MYVVGTYLLIIFYWTNYLATLQASDLQPATYLQERNINYK